MSSGLQQKIEARHIQMVPLLTESYETARSGVLVLR